MKRAYKVIGIIIGIAAIICAAVGIYLYIQENNAGAGYDELRSSVKIDHPIDTTELEDTPVQVPIDFETLQERNPDVYAWITVPGTEIDYPVLQRENDNAYYLSHTIDHEEKTEGAIFTENYNSKDFEDPNTVLYGHDMRNGSMFRSLLEYEDREFFDTNKEIIIYTPDAIRHYEIFAAYPYDNRHLLRSFDFSDPTVFQSYLDNIFATRDMSSCIDTSMEVDSDDKIITLSTCYGSQRDHRFLVQGVLVSIEK